MSNVRTHDGSVATSNSAQIVASVHFIAGLREALAGAPLQYDRPWGMSLYERGRLVGVAILARGLKTPKTPAEAALLYRALRVSGDIPAPQNKES